MKNPNRYDVSGDDVRIEAHRSGDYVEFADHEEIVDELTKRIEALEAVIRRAVEELEAA